MQNSIVRHFWILPATLDKLGKYFVVFNFRGTGLTAKISLFTVSFHIITQHIKFVFSLTHL